MKVPVERYWGLTAVNGVRVSGPAPTPPPADGFAPESGYSVFGSFVDGGSITISKTGGGFGTKTRGPSLVWDMGADVRISGVVDTTNALAQDGDLQGRANTQITTSRPHRHPRIDRQYATLVHNGRCFIVQSDRLAGATSRKYFAAMKIRMPLDPRRVRGVNYTSLTGTFIEGVDGGLGEPITLTRLGVNHAGNVLTLNGIYSPNFPNTIGIYTPGFSVTSGMTFTVTGDVSGAVAECNSNTNYRSSASGKIWRTNQSSSAAWKGIHTVAAISLPQNWIESEQGGIDAIGMNRSTYRLDYNSVAVYPEWHHVELCIDFTTPSATVLHHKATGALGVVSSVTPPIDASVNALESPITYQMIGYDASVLHPFAVDFGEIYADETPQRVVLTESAVYESSRVLEIARLQSWTNTQIETALYQGSHDDLRGKHLHWLDGDNVAHYIGSIT